jgi:aminoglycoside N3'-acetyltransferase
MWTKEEILKFLHEIPLTQSRHIMVHSSYNSLGWVEGGPETVIDALLEWVGPEGTVLFPTFDLHSWTEHHYYDTKETVSTMGIISELARLRPDAIRTPHPILPFAVIGRDKHVYEMCDGIESYGLDSVFSKFHENNGIIMGIGIQLDKIFEYSHYVEYLVGCDYRRNKSFSGTYVDTDGIGKLKIYNLYVRINWYPGKSPTVKKALSILFKSGIIRKTQICETDIKYAEVKPFCSAFAEIVQNNPDLIDKVK